MHAALFCVAVMVHLGILVISDAVHYTVVGYVAFFARSKRSRLTRITVVHVDGPLL